MMKTVKIIGKFCSTVSEFKSSVVFSSLNFSFKKPTRQNKTRKKKRKEKDRSGGGEMKMRGMKKQVPHPLKIPRNRET